VKRIILGALLVLGPLACDDDSDPTELVVLVNTDYKPVLQLAHVDVAVTTDADTAKQSWNIVSRDPGANETKIPFSFAIRPPGGDAGAQVDFTVSGLDPDKHTLVRRRVRVGFVAHQLRLLKIDLVHDCAGRFESCEQDGSASDPMTCVAGKCTGIDVNADDLPRIHPGDESDGAKTLIWHCTRDCDGAGMDGGLHRDASPEGGTGGHGGMDATLESGANGGMGGKGGKGGMGGKGGGGGSGGSSGTGGGPGDDRDDGVPDGCGDNQGFFADVEYRLLRTADGTPCPTIAQNYMEPAEGATVEQSTTSLHGLIDLALAANLDIIELWVSQSGSKLYATGDGSPTAALPELADILDYAPLRDSKRPVKLYFTDVVPESDQEFASAVLSLLLAKQTSAAGGYGNDCRPVYLDASFWRARNGLITTQALVADDPTYASLRGHLHFGFHVHPYETVTDAQEWIEEPASARLDYLDISLDHPSALPLVHYAQSRGLHVFVHQAIEPGYVPLCGVVDAISTPRFSFTPGTDFRDAIASSRTLIDLDIAGLASDATQLTYAVAPPGTSEPRSLDTSTPSLGTGGEVTQPLPGTYLSFDAAANQSLALNDPELPAGTNKLAMLVLLRFDAGTLPAGGRVIVSKRQGSSGWALELIDVGGTPQVQFESFVRNNGIGGVLGRQARIPASAFSPDASHHLFAAIDSGSYLRYRADMDWQTDGVPYEYSFVDNDAPVTLGRDPDATSGYFDGELQLFKLVSYSYTH
jgi:hypothetical protein